MKKHAIVILADGFEELEAVAPIDVLRRADITVTIIGLESIDVRGSHDIGLKADMPLGDFSGVFDAVVLPAVRDIKSS